MRLRCIGFCGIDDSVPISELRRLSATYPCIEWGVLLRADKEGTPRYPSSSYIQSLKGENLPLAAHFCGDYCLNVLNGNYEALEWLVDIGFRRFQFNPTKANNVSLMEELLPQYMESLLTAMAIFPQIEFIIQANQETALLWKPLLENSNTPPNMSLLFDASCGTGLPIETIPLSPKKGVKIGYAGGISADNILHILNLINSTSEGTEEEIWIDMESSLRAKNSGTGKDVFSIEACRACLSLVTSSTQYLEHNDSRV